MQQSLRGVRVRVRLATTGADIAARTEEAMSLILTEKRDSIATITMSHREKRNALSHTLIAEVVAALDRFRAEKARVVILRAPARAKVWSAGHDVNELSNPGRDPLGWADPLRVLVRSIQEFPAPVLALIEGSVWGGGCEVAMACDMAIATPEVTFAITPAKLGLPYNLSGLLTLMNGVPLLVAKEMLFTAQPIPTAQALNLGILNHVVSADEIEAFVYRIAANIAANAPLSVAVMKEELRLLAGARAISPEIFERIQGLRRLVYDSADYREGLDAMRAKRPPVFRGE